jgi:hypothetical protein
MKPLEKLGKSYVDLSQKLAEIEINSLERYTSYRDVTNYFSDYETLKRIEFCYAEKIINNIEEIFKDTSGLSGLCIFTKENQPSITDSHRKKFLLFSNATFINSSHIDIHGVDGLGYEDEPFEYQNGPDLSGCLEYIYNFLPEIRKGMILPVPRSAELFNYEGIYYESLDDVPDDPYTANRRTFTLPPNFYSVPLQSENLSKCEEILKIGLKVPSLDLIPIRTVRKLRKDYTEVFDRFQRFLVRASYKFSTENDDTRLKLILEEVEEEVDILHNSCQK